MTTFNESNLIKKLENVTGSQESIQTLSLWVLHHRGHYKKIVDHWLKCYIKAKSEHRLALFYLCNDIVQHAKRKNYVNYLNEFMQALREACKITNDEKIMNGINRVLDIWQERSVYSKEFINELKDLLCGEKVKAEMISKIISEHCCGDVIQQINNVTRMEQLTRSKYQGLVNCKIDFVNSDLLNKLKDKSYGEQFSKELDEATKCLESTVSTIEKEIAARKALIVLLEKSKVYYSIQMKESKNIAETFVNCELRLKQVQEELKKRGFNISSHQNKTSEMDSSQLSSVLNSVFLAQQQAHNNSVSSLDKRLTILMSGSGQFNLNLNQPTYGPTKSLGLSSIPSEFYLNDKNKEVNQIESVITSRTYSNDNPSENFEPADMDLGDSDDERQLNFGDALHQASTNPQAATKSMVDSLSTFISGQDMAKLLPLLPPPPPPPPMPPSFKEFLNSPPMNDPLDPTSAFIAGGPSPIQTVTSIPSIDHHPNNYHHLHHHPHHPQGDSIRSLTSSTSNRNSHHHGHHHSRNNQSPSSYHHSSASTSSSGQWRNNNNNNRNNNQSYHHYSNNRHGSGNNRWKNGTGSSSGSSSSSWKRESYHHY